jgi:hypothetical protein
MTFLKMHRASTSLAQHDAQSQLMLPPFRSYLIYLLFSRFSLMCLGISCITILVFATYVNSSEFKDVNGDRDRFPRRRLDGGTQLYIPTFENA